MLSCPSIISFSREKSVCNVLCFQAEERRGPAECADEGGELDERRQGSRQGLSPNDAGARSCKLRTPQKPTYEWEAATWKRSHHLRLMTSLFPKKTNKQTNYRSLCLHRPAQRGVSNFPPLEPRFKNVQFRSLKALQPRFLTPKMNGYRMLQFTVKTGPQSMALCGSHQMTEHLSRRRCSPTPVLPAWEVVKRTTPFTRMRTICRLSLLSAWKHGLQQHK